MPIESSQTHYTKGSEVNSLVHQASKSVCRHRGKKGSDIMNHCDWLGWTGHVKVNMKSSITILEWKHVQIKLSSQSEGRWSNQARTFLHCPSLYHYCNWGTCGGFWGFSTPCLGYMYVCVCVKRNLRAERTKTCMCGCCMATLKRLVFTFSRINRLQRSSWKQGI